jgi:hypothetical protein
MCHYFKIKIKLKVNLTLKFKADKNYSVNSGRVVCSTGTNIWVIGSKKLRGLSPRAKYTHRDPTAVLSVF